MNAWKGFCLIVADWNVFLSLLSLHFLMEAVKRRAQTDTHKERERGRECEGNLVEKKTHQYFVKLLFYYTSWRALTFTTFTTFPTFISFWLILMMAKCKSCWQFYLLTFFSFEPNNEKPFKAATMPVTREKGKCGHKCDRTQHFQRAKPIKILRACSIDCLTHNRLLVQSIMIK